MRWNPNSRFEINRYDLRSPKIRRTLTFAVIADLHNCFYGKNNLRLYDAIVTENPDAIVIAGDLIATGGSGDGKEGLKLLYRLSKRFPIYYGVGNHEKKLYLRDRYSRQRDELTFALKRSGVFLMHNSSREIEETGVVVTGLDIPHEYYRRIIHRKIDKTRLTGLLGKPDREKYNILIAHDPSHFKAYSDYGPDLVLSGHVHGGIIRLPGPGGLLSPEYKLFPKYDAGIYEKGRTKMLVSRGLGSHTINIRINNTPELIILRLANGND